MEFKRDHFHLYPGVVLCWVRWRALAQHDPDFVAFLKASGYAEQVR